MRAITRHHRLTATLTGTYLLSGFLLSIPPVQASPLPASTLVIPSNETLLQPRGAVSPLDAGDWLPLNSVGMMLPVKPGTARGGGSGNTIGDLQHMDYINPGIGAGDLPPGAPLKRNLHSRDLVRKNAYVTFDPETGAASYALQRRDDEGNGFDGEDEDEDGDGDEEEEEDEDEGSDDYQDDENDEEDDGDNDNAGETEEGENLSKRASDELNTSSPIRKNTSTSDTPGTVQKESNHDGGRTLANNGEPVLQGVSVLGTPSFKRSSGNLLARLFNRSNRKSLRNRKGKGNSGGSKHRKGRKKSGGKKQSRKSKSRKGKPKGRKGKKGSGKPKKGSKKQQGSLNLSKLDLMKGATILTTITWYTGIDLLNPFCDRKSKWTPTDEALIIAVTEKWSLRPACGEFMEITTQDDAEARSVIARIVDLCGGCIPEVAHADLSKAAFTKLYNLDVGRISGLKMRRVGAPKNWSDKLYGPREL